MSSFAHGRARLVNVIAATRFEYRFRYMLHGLIFVLGFTAPWERGWMQVGQHTVWVQAASYLYRHGMDFAASTNAVLILATLIALASAALRVWAAAYLGASVVHRESMAADRVVADGPYRYMRNPLYLGTVLFSLAVAALMHPSGAAVTVILIVVLQLRLIAREEPFLKQTLGPAYTEYCAQVPRILPRWKSRIAPGGTRPHWASAFLGEILFIGTAVSFLVLGWKYDAVLILQGILVSLGLGIVARAFIPQRG
ncbi:MAG: isoprenylcysteine carboxylmethyltransferase family protein [Acidobacteria bacterium]|nr:isoprenylcysteine carboxylmethyltransferase family protein [Acidobacteriota bacterium]